MSVLKLDPTRTVTIRRQFMTDMKRRYRRFQTRVVDLVEEQPQLDQQFFDQFAPSSQLEGRTWIQTEAAKALHQSDFMGQFWSHVYIRKAYESGAGKAYSAIVSGDESLEMFGGQQEFLRQLMGTAGLLLPMVHNARQSRKSVLGTLLSRTMEEIKGATNSMIQRLTRILADATTKGTKPGPASKLMAEEIRGKSRTRALSIAHNEVIRAHAEGQLDAFDALGVDELELEAEWTTSGLENVCPKCEALEGQIFTIAEARGLIPYHPLCMCSWTIHRKDKE